MKIITKNRKAHFNYEIDYTIEAGIVLTGDEVKSVRANHISLDEAFATLHDGHITLVNCHIAPYSHAYHKQETSHTSRRTRTLLLKKREILKLIGEISRRGMTLIPLKAYLNARGYVKIEIGIAKHKKAHNKKEAIKERDLQREASREIKQRIN